MCYDIKANLESQLRRAQLRADEAAIKELEEKIRPFLEPRLYHASGYAHPRTLIYTNKTPYWPDISVWGLIPSWVKDDQQRLKIWHNTLNARAETIFEKPSFKNSARHKRCIIILDGFYEHHHFKGKAYPFFIQHKDQQPFAVAGLWSEWADKETGELVNSFTIITTKANSLLAKIHRNPKLKEPRMPVILPESCINDWLATEITEKQAKVLLQPYPSGLLTAHPVQKLRGKNALGNVPEATKKVNYPELEIQV